MAEISEKKLNWLVALGSFLFIALLSFVGGEVYLRLAERHVTPETLREESLEYESTLFSRHAFPREVQRYDKTRKGTGAGRVNKWGFRGEDFSFSRPEDEVRVVVLGGSAAFDINAPRGEDWPHLVEEHLHRRGLSNIRVINAGTPGHRTWDSLGRLYSEIWMLEPDYVLLYHAWNDIKYFYQLDEENSLLRTFSPPPSFERNGRQMVWNPVIYYSGPVDRLLGNSQVYNWLRTGFLLWRQGKITLEGAVKGRWYNAGPEVFEDTFNPWGPRQYELNTRLFIEAAREIGAKPVLITQARLSTEDTTPEQKEKIRYHYVHLSHQGLLNAFGACDRVFYETARAKGVPILDLSRKLSGKEDYFTDAVHFTPAGSQAAGRAVGEFLTDVIDANK